MQLFGVKLTAVDDNACFPVLDSSIVELYSTREIAHIV